MEPPSAAASEPNADAPAVGRDNILYDVWIHDDTTLSQENLEAPPMPLELHQGGVWKALGSGIFNSIFGIFGLRIGTGPLLPHTVLDYLNSLPPYAIEATETGDKIVLLQQGKLSLRTNSEGFNVIVAEQAVPVQDPRKHLQRLAWSQDGSILILLTSTGSLILFDGNDLQVLGSLDLVKACSPDFALGSAGLVLRKTSRTGDKIYEAIAATFSGQIHRIIIPMDSDDPMAVLADFDHRKEEQREEAILKLSAFHSRCVALAYHAPSNTFAVAGLPENVNASAAMESATISLWNPLDDLPYYNAAGPGAKKEPQSQIPKLPSKRHTFESPSTLIKIAFNPTGDLLACLDVQGQLSIFRNGLKVKTYSSEFIYQGTKGDLLIEVPERDRIIRGLAWWDDSSVILARANGHVIVFGPVVAVSQAAANPSNRLGAAPEKFSAGVVLTAASASGRFFLFDAEQESVRVPKPVRVSSANGGADAAQGDAGDDSVDVEDENDFIAAGNAKQSEKSGLAGKLTSIFGKSESGDSASPSSSTGASVSSNWSPLGPKYINKRQTRYRMMSLASTTPSKLFRAKIDAQEYGQALKLAQVYGLPTDPVWQRRFYLDTVTKYSITDFLSKINDKRWVLRECKRRVAMTEASQRALLEYGLKIALPSCFEQQRRAKDKSPESSGSESDDDNADEEHQSGSNSDRQDGEGVSRPHHQEQHHSKNIAAAHMSYLATHVLSIDDIEMLLFRLVFLKLLDRLSSFSAICRSASRSYDPQSWLKFRSAHLVSAAIDYALDEHCTALDILFTYHSEQTLPYRLNLLDCIPSTCLPDVYQALLPALDVPKEHADTVITGNYLEVDWDRRKWRKEPDFVESPAVLQNLLNSLSHHFKDKEDQKQLSSFSVEALNDLGDVLKLLSALKGPKSEFDSEESLFGISSPDLYAPEDEHVAAFPHRILPDLSMIAPVPTFPHDSSVISKWVVHRARAIERLTGQVDVAIRFCDLCISHGILTQDVHQIRYHLATLSTLVYECGKINMSLADYGTLSPLQLLSFLLEPLPAVGDQESIDKIPYLIKARAAAVLYRDRQLWHGGGLSKGDNGAIATWMVQQVKNHRFDLCVPIFIDSIPENPTRLIDHDEAAATIALEVVYACPDTTTEALKAMDVILDKMDGLEVSETLTNRMSIANEHVFSLHILLEYDCAKPIAHFLTEWSPDVPNGVENVRQLIARVVQRGVRAKPAWDAPKWERLLENLNHLHEDLFHSMITAEYVYAQFCKALLKAGQWKLARHYLESAVGPNELIVSTAVEYFNSCNNPFDQAMHSAVACLKVVEPLPEFEGPGVPVKKSSRLSMTPEIRSELDLIDGARRLYKFGLEVLPLQLRTARSRAALLKPVFSVASNLESSTFEEILSAAELIGITKPDDKLALRLLAAETAEETDQLLIACNLCFELIKIGYTKQWSLCLKLAQNESPHAPSLENRMRLAAFASLHCPKRESETVISLWRSLEARYRCQQLGIDEDDADINTIHADDSIDADSSQRDDVAMISTSHQRVLHSCMQKLVDFDSSDIVQRGVALASQSAVQIAEDFSAMTHDFYSRQSKAGSIYTNFDIAEARSDNLIDSCKAEIFKLSHLTRSASSARNDAAKHSATIALRSNDIPLFLAAVGSLDSPQTSKQFFDELISRHAPTQAERITRLAAYFYGLSALFELVNIPGNKLLPEISHRPDLCGVSELFNVCDNLKHCDSPSWPLYGVFRARLSDFGRVKELSALHLDIDVTRFGMDDSYKRQVILEMAASLNADTLRQAIDLAKKYQTPDLCTVLCEHLAHYFVSKSTLTQNVHPTDYLKEYDAALLARPDSLAARLESVLPLVEGDDYVKMIYWYELKRDTALSTRATRFQRKESDAANEAALCQLHIKLLQKLSKIRPHLKISYQKLCISSESARAEIACAVTESNVFGLAKASSELTAVLKSQDAEEKEISSSNVFLLLILRLLDSTNSPPDELILNSKENAPKLMSRLDALDLAELVRLKVIGSTDAIRTPLEARLNTARAVCELLNSDEHKRKQQQQSSSTAEAEAPANVVTKDYVTAAEQHLSFIKKLWDWLLSSSSSLGSPKFNRRAYFEQFDVAFRDGAAFNAAFKQMLANGIDPNIIGYFSTQTRREEAARWKPEKKTVLDLQTLYKTVVDEIIRNMDHFDSSTENEEESAESNSASDAEVEESDEEILIATQMQDRVISFPPASSKVASIMLENILTALKTTSAPPPSSSASSSPDFDSTGSTSVEMLEKTKIFVLDKLRSVSVDESASTPRRTRIAVLRILLRHKEFYQIGKPNRTQLHRSDAQTLEALTSSDIITNLISSSNNGVPMQEGDDMNQESSKAVAESPEQKISLFERLIGAARADREKLSQVANLLTVWTRSHITNVLEQKSALRRTLAASDEIVFSGCWRNLLITIADNGLWDLFWQIYVAFPEIQHSLDSESKKFLNDDDEQAIFQHLLTSQSRKMHAIKFGLKASGSTAYDLASAELERLLEPSRHSQSPHLSILSLFSSFFSSQDAPELRFGVDYDLWLVLLIIRKNLLHLIPTTCEMFSVAVNVLLWHNEPTRHLADFSVACNSAPVSSEGRKLSPTEIEAELSQILKENFSEDDASLSFEATVAALAFRSHFSLAGHIAMIHRNVPKRLRTTENGLSSLPQYLSDRVSQLQPRGAAPGAAALRNSQNMTDFAVDEGSRARLAIGLTWEQCRLNCREALQAYIEATDQNLS